MDKESYQEYLNSQFWKDKRSDVLNYYGYRCAVCNSEYNLHVHHRTYERIPMEQFTDLIALCEDCHALFHGKAKV